MKIRDESRRIKLWPLGLAGTVLFFAASSASAIPPHKVGLGKTLTTKDHGQIYGFDVNQNGNDGVLASAKSASVSVETFDEETGKITKVFATKNGGRNSYVVDGIFSGDVGLVTHSIIPKGQLYGRLQFELMNPVTAQKFTGSWTPPLKDVGIALVAENQSSANSVFYGIELKKQDQPDLIVSNVANNTFSKIIKLDANSFSLGSSPQLGEYSSANEAVMAESPDGGARHGDAPLNFLFDLSTGKSTSFAGYNNGPYHAGDVNGLATDPNTGITATDTEMNAQIEFYDMANQMGITAVQLPCTGDGDQTYSGSGIAVDPLNKLFLVTETEDACNNGSTGAIIVYDESGNYIETISGFSFVLGEPAPAINPGKRMGWALGGAGLTQLRQFFY